MPGEIEIINRTSSTYTTGIAEAVNGVTAPYCAFSLPDQKACHLRPVPRVLLMFASTPMGIGTVTTQAPSNGVLIDMSSASQRRVSFDAGTGWSWEGSSRVWPVPSNADLVRLLTEPGPDEGA